MSVLFLYLKAFSFTGGIEKFNRSLMKALHELSIDGMIDADAISAYDHKTDERYFPQLRFQGCAGSKVMFVLKALQRSARYKTVIIGHINLAFVGYWIKRLNPSARIIVIAHGIEVWMTHTGVKRKLLDHADMILSVSQFTADQIVLFNPTVKRDKIRVFPNTIDPYFPVPASFEKPAYLLERYQIKQSAPVLLTVTRLSSSEKYKGYDKLIAVLPDLVKEKPDLQYVICGKADDEERSRIGKLIEENGVSQHVKLLGFIEDRELIDHYLLGDVFVMQSKGEGFGIVFIEALACGRQVIAGSKDGSSEALMHGKLGQLIDPDDGDALQHAIDVALATPVHTPDELQRHVLDEFGFSRFKQKLCDHLLTAV